MAEHERYYIAAKDLKKVAHFKKEKGQAALRQLNYYSLGVFAAYLSEYLEVLRTRIPDINLPSRKPVKSAIIQASNILESIVGGLGTKYITKEMARNEIKIVANIIEQIIIVLKKRGDELKQEQILSLQGPKVNAAFKSISIADLGEYVRTQQRIDEMMAPIIKKYQENTPSKTLTPEPVIITPKQDDDNTPVDPYASPSNYNAYVDKMTRGFHTSFNKASKLIKIPNNIGPNESEGQVLWSVAKLPLYMTTNPPLKLNELDKAGIKYDQLAKNAFILYNQLVLVVWRGKVNAIPEDKLKRGQVQEKVPSNFIGYNDTINRAKKQIFDQFHRDFLYSKPFSSKEVGKPLDFYWVLEPRKLSHFVISLIALPFTPELKKVEDLTYDVQTIRKETAEQQQKQEEHTRERKELAAPLIEQYQSIKKQIEDTAKALKGKKLQLQALEDGHKAAKLAQLSMRQGSPEWTKQMSRITALESQIGILTDDIINEKTVRTMNLKQKQADIEKEIRRFNGARV